MDTDHIQLIVAHSELNEVKETVDPAQQQQVEYKLDTPRANVFYEKIIRKLDQVPEDIRNNYIYKVDEATRKGHQNPYEPILYAIGPYHRGKINLQPMEEHKWQCLNKMIGYVTGYTGISRYDLIKRCYDELEAVEDVARGYYAEDIGLDSSEFLEMLLVDGCFLVTIIRGEIYEGEIRYMTKQILNHDVLLLENQLPFFILKGLHSLMVTQSNNKNGSMVLVQLVLQSNIFPSVIEAIRPGSRVIEDHTGIVVGVSKLYDNSHNFFGNEGPEDLKQMLADVTVQENERKIDQEKLENIKHLLDLMYKVLLREEMLDIPVATRTTIQVESQGELFDLLNERRNTYSVTELSNAGVKFKAVDKQKFYDIQFKNRTLEIPRIVVVRNTTEGVFRNLMGYEVSEEDECIINDYVFFMDSIISSEKDVELLRSHGIIEHFLGTDEAVSTMFNQLGAISARGIVYRYSDISKQLKQHCGKRQNVWMAKLRSDYFSSPWAIISFIAAFVLLFLTVMSTVYSVLSYYNAG